MGSPHQWKFFRAGGFDQVQIDNGADLLAERTGSEIVGCAEFNR